MDSSGPADAMAPTVAASAVSATRAPVPLRANVSKIAGNAARRRCEGDVDLMELLRGRSWRSRARAVLTVGLVLAGTTGCGGGAASPGEPSGTSEQSPEGV